MVANLRLHLLVAAVVVGFLSWAAAQEVAQGRHDGTELVFRIKLEQDVRRNRDKVLWVVQKRLVRYGLDDIVLKPIGADSFSVRISARDKSRVTRIKDLITALGKLEFRITVEKNTPAFERYFKLFQKALSKGVSEEKARVISPGDLTPAARARYPQGLRWFMVAGGAKSSLAERSRRDDTGERWMLVKLDPHNVTGDALYNIYSARDVSGIGPSWAIYFSVKESFRKRFAALTAFEEDKYMAVILNDQVHTAPVLRSALSDKGQITGAYTKEAARALAAMLQAGSIDHKLELVSERAIVSPAGNEDKKREAPKEADKKR